MAGAEPEVVGVAEDDLRAEFLKFGRMQRFYRALGADGHEDGGFDLAVGESQGARTCGTVGGLEGEGHPVRRLLGDLFYVTRLERD